MAKQKRDREYYLRRLKKERPDLYADIAAGKLTVGRARKLAGMGGTRTKLQELKGAWRKATPAEQSDFLRWVGSVTPSVTTAPAPISTAPRKSAFEPDGRLQAWAARRTAEIMTRRMMNPGDLADELGIDRLNPTVMLAVRRGYRIKDPATASALERWLVSNASV